jgi:AAA domain/Primase C terminal 2 (PriCT-2)
MDAHRSGQTHTTNPRWRAPDWVPAWACERNNQKRPTINGEGLSWLGPRPDYLGPSLGVSDDIAAANREWSEAAEARLRGALQKLPPDCGYGEWLEAGMALRELGWAICVETGGITEDRGFELWNEWSSGALQGKEAKKYRGREALERKWASFAGNYKGRKVTVGTIFHRAREYGWQGECVRPPSGSRCDHTTEAGEEDYQTQGSYDHGSEQEQENRTNQQKKDGQTSQEQKGGNPGGGTTQSAHPLRWHGEENPSANRNWLIKHLLPTTGVGLISGQWGTGKTFVAIDLALSLMTGTPFAGRTAKRKGGVLFIAAEGASEIPIRLSGLIEAKLPDHKDKLPFAWAESWPMLMVSGAVEQLAVIAKEAADRMKAEFGVDLVLVIVDTMSAAAGFKDENASSEAQFVMNVLSELSRRTGALILACDHFGKAVETGTRGSSAKEAAADVVIACLGDRAQAGSVTALSIAVRKLRSGATGAETPFRLRTVDMGVDEDGEPITTCVVEWSPVTVAPAPEAAKGRGWPKSTVLFRVALVTTLKLHGSDQMVLGGPTVVAVELDRVREEFDKRYPLDAGGNAIERKRQVNKRRQAFKRAREEVESRGLIGGREIDGKFMVWLTRPEEEGVLRPGGFHGQPTA